MPNNILLERKLKEWIGGNVLRYGNQGKSLRLGEIIEIEVNRVKSLRLEEMYIDLETKENHLDWRTWVNKAHLSPPNLRSNFPCNIHAKFLQPRTILGMDIALRLGTDIACMAFTGVYSPNPLI